MKEAGSSRFFQNRDCEYFPCHCGVSEEEFNCLFCYCPLYALGKQCGGSCTYTEKGIKSCKNCVFPHRKENYEKITYEGYGPQGVAVIVEAMTDNRNRTAGEIRHYFDKYGGNMGTANCVSWSFDRKGVIVIDNEDEELDEDTVMMDALDVGAADFEAEDLVFNVYTGEDEIASVADALTAKGYTLLSAQVEMLPQNGYIKLTNEDDIKNMQKMLDMFEDNDDVQNVWHNWEDAE